MNTDKSAKVTLAESEDFAEIQTVADLKKLFDTEQLDDSKSCKDTLCGLCCGWKNECKCSRECVQETLFQRLPIINAFRTYQFKKFLLSDFIAGLTVGIMHIPQGMGFALLAGLPPVIGLYTSFFPVLMYFFFTPSRSTSFGTQSLVCLMLGSLLERECIEAGHCSIKIEGDPATLPMASNYSTWATTADNSIQDTTVANFDVVNLTSSFPGTTTPKVEHTGHLAFTDDVHFKVSLAVTLAFLIGIIQMLMSVFRLGVVSIYFSETFISACNCGAAFQIATTQVKFLLGLNLPPPSGRFGLTKTWLMVIQAWRYINIADLVVSFLSILAMILVKKLINERYKDRLKIPVPIEIIVVVLSTAIARLASLNERLGVTVVGEIPQGIPPPSLPQVSTIRATHVMDAIPVALIGFLSAVLMAKMFANKYEYRVDINQELFANGIANLFSSFFNCFPSSVAPPRTMLFDSVGGRTQIAYTFSCALVLLVLVLIGPLFQTLPTAVLASIIVVALIPLFEGMRVVPYLWKVNKLDFVVWFGTIVSVIVFDLGPGIVIGVLLSILSVVIHTQRPQANVTYPLQPESNIYLRNSLLRGDPEQRATSASSAINGKVIVFKFDCPLYYANYETFVNELTAALMPHIVKMKQGQQSNTHSNAATANGSVDGNANSRTVNNGHEMKPLMAPGFTDRLVLVLDFSSVHYLDVVGIKVIKMVYTKLSNIGIKITMASCCLEILKTLERADVLSLIGEENIYMNVHDAVVKHS